MSRFAWAFAIAFVLVAAGPRVSRAQDGPRDGVAPLSTEAQAARRIVLDRGYKGGAYYPLRNFQGLDFLEPFVPIAAWSRGDGGRIVLNTLMPGAMLVSAFALRGTDIRTRMEIDRWNWVNPDSSSNNFVTLYALMIGAGLGTFLPSPEDGDGYSLNLRLDRATVYCLGMLATSIQELTLKPLFNRTRPNGTLGSSRPSGHALSAFASAAFLADVLRDWFRPQDEDDFAIRLFKEIGCGLPYLGAFCIALSRVNGNKHFLSDVLLGGALGALTMHLFYSWSFTRLEQGRAWFDTISLGYDPERKGVTFAFVKNF